MDADKSVVDSNEKRYNASACIVNASTRIVNVSTCIVNVSTCIVNASARIVNASTRIVNASARIANASACILEEKKSDRLTGMTKGDRLSLNRQKPHTETVLRERVGMNGGTGNRARKRAIVVIATDA